MFSVISPSPWTSIHMQFNSKSSRAYLQNMSWIHALCVKFHPPVILQHVPFSDFFPSTLFPIQLPEKSSRNMTLNNLNNKLITLYPHLQPHLCHSPHLWTMITWTFISWSKSWSLLSGSSTITIINHKSLNKSQRGGHLLSGKSIMAY